MSEDIAALACEDCPAIVNAHRGRGIDGRSILVVAVEHAATCPWAREYVAGETHVVHGDQLLIHSIADA